MTALLTFLLDELIPSQITKYKELASVGIGPDARINARLVKEEVDDLIRIATELLAPHADQFESHFNQVWFYVEQEHLRGQAGWLIAENNPHDRVYERTLTQQQTLKKIAHENAINFPSSFTAQGLQEKCARYSHAIAFFILDHAKKLKYDLKSELPASIPAHAQTILRANAKAGGRYHQSPIKEQIDSLHERCVLVLNPESKAVEDDLIQKTRDLVQAYRRKPAYSPLLQEEAIKLAKEDEQKLNALKRLAHPLKHSFSLKKYGLFAAVATTLIGAGLVTYLKKSA